MQIRQICTENLGATLLGIKRLLLGASLQLSCKRLWRHHGELFSLAKKMSHRRPVTLLSNSVNSWFFWQENIISRFIIELHLKMQHKTEGHTLLEGMKGKREPKKILSVKSSTIHLFYSPSRAGCLFFLAH